MTEFSGTFCFTDYTDANDREIYLFKSIHESSFELELLPASQRLKRQKKAIFKWVGTEQYRQLLVLAEHLSDSKRALNSFKDG
jgi:hypothetical protein